MFTKTLEIVAPIFLIVLVGYLARRFGLAKENWVHLLNRFVYFVSLPALIIASFWNVNWRAVGLGSALAWNFGLMVFFAVLVVVILKFLKISKEMRASIFMSLIVGNTVYMGFPLVGRTVDAGQYDAVVAVATLQLVLGLLFSVFAIEFWVIRSKKLKIYVDDLLASPLIISLVVGLILGFLGWQDKTASTIKSAFTMLGATASPLALFGLGAFMHGKFMKFHARASWLVSIFKIVIIPALAFFVLRKLGLPHYVVDVSALLFAMPVAVTTFVLSEKYDLEKHFNASVIVLSTALSVIVIPIFLILFL